MARRDLSGDFNPCEDGEGPDLLGRRDGGGRRRVLAAGLHTEGENAGAGHPPVAGLDQRWCRPSATRGSCDSGSLSRP